MRIRHSICEVLQIPTIRESSFFQKLTARFIIKHDGIFRNYWDSLMGVALIYISISLPYTVAFYSAPPDTTRSLETVIDYYFYTDLPVNFLTTYQDENGKIVDDFCEISKRYLKTWFFIDLFSVLPMEKFFSGQMGRISKLSKVLRMLKLLKILRVSKLGRLIPIMQAKYDMKNSYITVMKFCIGTIWFAHCAGCFYFLLARWQDFPISSWVFLREVDSLPLYNQTTGVKYIICFYWAITTMSTVGFGDVIPGTDIERFYVLIIMFSGACIFAFAVTQMYLVLQNMNHLAGMLVTVQDKCEFFFWQQRMSRKISSRTKRYLAYKFYHSTVDMFDSMQYLSVCSEDIQARFYAERCQHNFYGVEIITKYGDFFIHCVARYLKGNLYCANTTIMLETFQNNIFLIAVGKVEIILDACLIPKCLEESNLIEKKYKGRNSNSKMDNLIERKVYMDHPNKNKVQYDTIHKEQNCVGSAINACAMPKNNRINTFPLLKKEFFPLGEQQPCLRGVSIKVKRIVLTERCTFNEVASILQKKSTVSAYASSFCDVYRIHASDYLLTLKEYFPAEHQKLLENFHEKSKRNLDFEDYTLAKNFDIEGNELPVPEKDRFIYNFENTNEEKLRNMIRVLNVKKRQEKNVEKKITRVTNAKEIQKKQKMEDETNRKTLHKNNASKSNSNVSKSKLNELRGCIGNAQLHVDRLEHNLTQDTPLSILKEAIEQKYNLIFE